jgi:acyl-CoA reductase-like NAD-dependent aldehyde dehydrogenase
MRAAKDASTHNNNRLVSFSLKITPKEKEKIKALSGKQRKPASRAIMELVNKAVGDAPRMTTVGEIRNMSHADRSRLLRAQAALAAKHYEVVADGFDIVEY